MKSGTATGRFREKKNFVSGFLYKQTRLSHPMLAPGNGKSARMTQSIIESAYFFTSIDKIHVFIMRKDIMFISIINSGKPLPVQKQ